MSFIQNAFHTAFAALLPVLASPLLCAQSPATPFDASLVSPETAPEGPTLGEMIGSIAEKDSREAADFEQLAQMTLQLGQSALQQGQRIPDTSIWDGIHAVESGRAINPLRADWDTLRQELEKLLEEPPQDEQQQDQNQENQDQENQEQSEEQNQSDEQNSESDSNDEPSESQESESSEDQNSENQESPQSQENDEQSQSGEQQSQQPQQSESLGDMDDSQETPQLDQQPEEEQTQVGGTQQQPPPRSAKQAMTLQQLEQLKQQDKPGALHMMLQNAERDENAPPPQKLKKDW